MAAVFKSSYGIIVSWGMAIGLLGKNQAIRLTSPLLSAREEYPQNDAFKSKDHMPYHTAGNEKPKSELHDFQYHISAAFSGKGQRFIPDRNVYNFDWSTPGQPKPQYSKNNKPVTKKRPNSGQDAFFVSRVSESDMVAFGVADGVGGWADSGVDSADFSHGFCNYVAESAHDFKVPTGLTAKRLMEMGYQKIVEDETVVAGGSTACIGIARGDGSVEIANLGDSGYILLRSNAVYHYSEPQTHAFNTPYQLSLIPPRMLAQAAVFGGAPLRDLPRDASVTHHDVKHGDVLVFATDGVWDNISPQEILWTVSRFMTTFRGWKSVGSTGMAGSKHLRRLTQPGGTGKAGDTTQDDETLQSLIATAITRDAKSASMNTKRDGPFAKEVQKLYPEEGFRGGKVDDICVLVVIVVRVQPNSQMSTEADP